MHDICSAMCATFCACGPYDCKAQLPPWRHDEVLSPALKWFCRCKRRHSSHLDQGTRRKAGLKPPCLSECALEMADAAALQEEVPGWERHKEIDFTLLHGVACYRQSGKLGAGLHRIGIAFQPARIHQRICLPKKLATMWTDESSCGNIPTAGETSTLQCVTPPSR